MTPAPSPYHQEVLGNLFYQVKKYLGDKSCKPYIAPLDVRFPEGDEADEDILTVVQPDLLIVCDVDKKIDHKGCKGAPDLIIEVISPYTAQKDLKFKFRLYQKHHVKEYWVVHSHERIVNVHKLNEQGKYDTGEIYSQKETILLELKGGTLEIGLKTVF